MVNRSNIKQEITKTGDIKMKATVAKKVRGAVRSAQQKGPKKKKKIIKRRTRC